MKNIIIYILIFVALIFSSGCVENNNIIGGEKDSNGCLIPAGYSWNDSLKICIREWEVKNESLRDAIRLATNYIYAPDPRTFGLIFDSIEVGQNQGDFVVHMIRDFVNTTDNSIIRKNYDVYIEGMEICLIEGEVDIGDEYKCCRDFVEIPYTKFLDENNKSVDNSINCIFPKTGGVCTYCGNEQCGLGENWCNCPSDC